MMIPAFPELWWSLKEDKHISGDERIMETFVPLYGVLYLET